MAMTKRDYLDKLQKTASHNVSLKSTVGQKKLLTKIATLTLSAVILTGAAAGMTSYSREASYESGTVPAWADLSYKDNFLKLNHAPIGNDINTLLNGGKVLTRDSAKAFGLKTEDKQLMYLGAVSYINYVGDSYIYRDDKDRHIYEYNSSNRNRHEIFQGNAGEVFCVGGKVYFINLDNKQSIDAIEIDDGAGARQEIVKEPVQTFAVCNDVIIYLTTEHRLYVKSLDSKKSSLLSSNIEAFFLDGHILAKSGKKVLRFTTDGALTKQVYSSSASDFSLVGVDDDTIYIQEDGKLLAYGKEGIHEVVSEKHKFYRSLAYDKDSKMIYVIAYDNKGENIMESLLNWKKV